ncbi:MAG: hypothetical protein ACOCV1_03265 [Bacillota bacterium]
MKKLLVMVLAFTIGLILVGCNGDSEEVIQSDEQVLTLEAISSSMLLSYNEEGVEELALPAQAKNAFAEQELEDLDYYVEMVEVFLGNENLQIETQESDLEEYDNKVVYTTRTLNDEEISYTFYYNEFELVDEEETTEGTEEETTEGTEEETTKGTEEETNSGNSQMNQFRFDDEDDHLITSGIEGILIFNETTYNIEGKVINIDGKEIVRLRSYIDEGNFVLVNYQNDVNETKNHEKFFFKLVEDGITINQSKVMIFENDKILHVQLEMTEGENYSRYQFHVRTRDEITYIHINYRIETTEGTERGNIRLTKEIDPETGDPVYNYAVTPENGRNNPSNHSRRHRHKYNETTERQNT